MLSALLVTGLLAAAPGSARVAIPGFSLADIPEDRGGFFLEYFATQLAAQTDMRVTTPREVAVLLGAERQRQLLGCGESSAECIAELSGALGVDGIILGSMARLPGGYAANVRIVSASDGTPWASTSGQVRGRDDALVGWLGEATLEPGRKLDARSNGASAVEVRRQSAHAVRLVAPFLLAEYDHRVSGPWWFGGRFGFQGVLSPPVRYAGSYLGTSLGGGALVRYLPPAGGPFAWGLFAGVGFVRTNVVDIDLSRYLGFQGFLGAEAGIYGFRLGLELQAHVPGSSSGTGRFEFEPGVLLVPSLSYVFEF
jgi:hypothetical protein